MANSTDIKSLSSSISNISQNSPDLASSQKFGTAIMDLLKQYQGIEKLPYAGQGLNAQTEQVKRIQSTPSNLIGADPSLQSSVRSASVSAVQPTVSGAEQAGQTFASRLSTFADVLNTAQTIQSKAEQSAQQAKADAMNLINNAYANFGADSFKNTDPKDIAALEKLAGVPSGYIANVAGAIKAKEAADYQKELSLRNASQGPRNRQVATITKVDADGNQYEEIIDVQTGQTIASGANTSTPTTSEIPTFEQFIADKQSKSGMSFSQTKRDSLKQEYDTLVNNVQSKPVFKALPSKLVTPVNTIANSFDNEQIVKDYNIVGSKLQSMNKIIDSGVGGPGDLALVFEFMKGLDPSSVVRESEYAAAAKSGNIFRGSMAKFNGYFKDKGGFLPEQVKTAFRDIVSKKFETATTQYKNVYNEYGRRINNLTGRTDGTSFITDYSKAFTNSTNQSSGGSQWQSPSGNSYTLPN